MPNFCLVAAAVSLACAVAVIGACIISGRLSHAEEGDTRQMIDFAPEIRYIKHV